MSNEEKVNNVGGINDKIINTNEMSSIDNVNLDGKQDEKDKDKNKEVIVSNPKIAANLNEQISDSNDKEPETLNWASAVEDEEKYLEKLRLKVYDVDRAKFNNPVILHMDEPFNRKINDSDFDVQWIRLTKRKFEWGEFSGCYIPKSIIRESKVSINVVDQCCIQCIKGSQRVGTPESEISTMIENNRVRECVWDIKFGYPIFSVKNLLIIRDIMHTMDLHPALNNRDELHYYRHLLHIRYSKDGTPNKLMFGSDSYELTLNNGISLIPSEFMSTVSIAPNVRRERNRETEEFLKVAALKRNVRNDTQRIAFNKFEDKYMLRFGLYDREGHVKVDFNIETHLKIVYQRLSILITYFRYYFQGYINMRTPTSAIHFQKDNRDKSLVVLNYLKSKDTTLTDGVHNPDVNRDTVVNEGASTSREHAYDINTDTSQVHNAWVKPITERINYDEIDLETSTGIARWTNELTICRGTTMFVDEKKRGVATVLGRLPIVMPCSNTKIIIVEIERNYVFPLAYKIEAEKVLKQIPLSACRIVLSYLINDFSYALKHGNINTESLDVLNRNVQSFTNDKWGELTSRCASFRLPSIDCFRIIIKHISSDHIAVTHIRSFCKCIYNMIKMKENDSVQVCEKCTNEGIQMWLNGDKYVGKVDMRCRDMFIQYIIGDENKFRSRVTLEEALNDVKASVNEADMSSACLKMIVIICEILKFKDELCRTCIGLLFVVGSGFMLNRSIVLRFCQHDIIKDVTPRFIDSLSTWTILGGLFQFASIECTVPVDASTSDEWKGIVQLSNIIYNDPSVLNALVIKRVMSKIAKGQSMRLSAFSNDRIAIFSDDNMELGDVLWNCFGAASGMWKTLIKFSIKSINISISCRNNTNKFNVLESKILLPHFPQLYPNVDHAITIELGATSEKMLKDKHESIYLPKMTFHIYAQNDDIRYNVSLSCLSEIAKRVNMVLHKKEPALSKDIIASPNRKGTGIIFLTGGVDSAIIVDHRLALKRIFDDDMMKPMDDTECKITLLDLIVHSIMIDLTTVVLGKRIFNITVVCKMHTRIYYYPLSNIEISPKECDDNSKIIVKERPKLSSMQTIEDVIHKLFI